LRKETLSESRLIQAELRRWKLDPIEKEVGCAIPAFVVRRSIASEGIAFVFLTMRYPNVKGTRTATLRFE